VLFLGEIVGEGEREGLVDREGVAVLLVDREGVEVDREGVDNEALLVDEEVDKGAVDREAKFSLKTVSILTNFDGLYENSMGLLGRIVCGLLGEDCFSLLE
jgi:hypothetical protein